MDKVSSCSLKISLNLQSFRHIGTKLSLLIFYFSMHTLFVQYKVMQTYAPTVCFFCASAHTWSFSSMSSNAKNLVSYLTNVVHERNVAAAKKCFN